jgi:hypothetical protein
MGLVRMISLIFALLRVDFVVSAKSRWDLDVEYGFRLEQGKMTRQSVFPRGLKRSATRFLNLKTSGQ